MRLVFDADEWDKTGDIGDNSQFWKPATILKTDFDGTATVRFEDGRISKGHYIDAMKMIEAKVESHQCQCESCVNYRAGKTREA